MSVLSVGQLAARAGVRPDTIRYYERSGVLPQPCRSDGDHRRYGPADVDRLLFVRGAQRLGLRLTEIRDLLAVRDTGVCPCEPAEQVLSRHVAEIDNEMARLAALREELVTMLAGMQTGPCGPDPVPGTWCLTREGGDALCARAVTIRRANARVTVSAADPTR
jgi:DNA-binding transcriptional MerR regulator